MFNLRFSAGLVKKEEKENKDYTSGGSLLCGAAARLSCALPADSAGRVAGRAGRSAQQNINPITISSLQFTQNGGNMQIFALRMLVIMQKLQKLTKVSIKASFYCEFLYLQCPILWCTVGHQAVKYI